MESDVLPPRKRIALVAHDNRKDELLDLVDMNYNLGTCVDDYIKVLRDILNRYLNTGEIHKPNKDVLHTYYNWGKYIKTCSDAY